MIVKTRAARVDARDGSIFSDLGMYFVMLLGLLQHAGFQPLDLCNTSLVWTVSSFVSAVTADDLVVFDQYSTRSIDAICKSPSPAMIWKEASISSRSRKQQR